MTARPVPHGSAVRSRAGFTLLEMLAVILIIAILMALAFPAYQAVMINARNATVRTEMATLGTAIGDFKSKYGLEPPSRISFVVSGGDLPPTTKAILRKMFPQIDTTTSAFLTSITQAGLLNEELVGNEALVFFLGGIRRNTGTTVTTLTDELIGFSKNPSNPFAQPGAGQSTRVGPFFEFKTSQLSRNADAANDSGSVEQLVYSDALSTKPYIYASTAATGKYLDGTTAATSDFPDLGGSFFKAYRRPDATPLTTDNPFWNPSSYQLISVGPDAQAGVGGVYDPKSTGDLGPFDADNLANFADGPLGG